jgi:hypothetical protein
MAEERQGTSGWIIFAATMIAIGSLSHWSTGLTFVFNTTWALATTDFVSESTVKLIGWIQLGIGALMVVSAWGVLSAKKWARAVGIIFGVITVISGITNLAVNGFFAVLGILVGVGVIFALTAKGDVVAGDQVMMGDKGAPLLYDVPGQDVVDEEKPKDH